VKSYTGGTINTTTDFVLISSSSGNSAVFEYYVSNGTARRAGSVLSVWDNSGNSESTDYSTPDLGGSTTGISFVTVISTGNLVLRAVVTSGTWTINVGARVIF
jgi:hypothetical protein